VTIVPSAALLSFGLSGQRLGKLDMVGVLKARD